MQPATARDALAWTNEEKYLFVCDVSQPLGVPGTQYETPLQN